MGAYPRLPSKPELLLPEDFASAIWEVALELDAAIEFDVVRAEQLARRELALLAQAEEVSGRRLHKGHPLHNLGVALHRSDPTEARVHFAAAHAEDARLWRRHRPAAWAFLAGKTLLGLFQDTRSQLRWLERAARRTPLEDPVKVGRQYAQQFDKPPPFPRRPEGLRSEADLLRIPADKRVFIGGSYAGARDRLDTMEDAVRSEGYEPVVVAESETLPGETNRAKSFRLLDRCNRAVFEGTVQDQPGWWPEIERIVQVRPIPTLVVWLAGAEDWEYRTSSMFPTPGEYPCLRVEKWGTREHLQQVVQWWVRGQTIGEATTVRGLALRFVTISAPSGSQAPYYPFPSGVRYEQTAIGSNTPYFGGSAVPYKDDLNTRRR